MLLVTVVKLNQHIYKQCKSWLVCRINWSTVGQQGITTCSLETVWDTQRTVPSMKQLNKLKKTFLRQCHPT